MSRILRRAAAVAVAALIPAAVLVPTASADIATFPDVGGHITSVRVSHGPKTVGITAFDAEMDLRHLLPVLAGHQPERPGAGVHVEVIPDSDGFGLGKVANFASSGIEIRVRRASGQSPTPAARSTPRSSCRAAASGTPSKVRVAVVGYYYDDGSLESWTGRPARSGSTPGSSAERWTTRS